jgi:hypothetical protein
MGFIKFATNEDLYQLVPFDQHRHGSLLGQK